MAETRKLAAIPAADVVGYSRLAGSDEERTATAFEHQQAGARAGREPTIRGCIAWKPSQRCSIFHRSILNRLHSRK
jgi:hypothetical protein